MTDYIALMILSPFLNKLIAGLSRKTFLKLLFVVLGIWCVLPTVTELSFDYSFLLWFVVLYLIGGFIRLHLDIDKVKSKYLVLAGSSSLIMCFVLYVFFRSCALITGNNAFTSFSYSLIGENSVFIFIVSVSLFLIFLKRNEFSNKYINFISGSVLGVYLIHDNNLVRPYLWNTILKVTSHYQSEYFIIYAIIAILSIFIICILIDVLRRLTVEKIWVWFIDCKLDGISAWANNVLLGVEEKIGYYLK